MTTDNCAGVDSATFALALLVVSETDVAVIISSVPVEVLAGAVNIVAVPLAVADGLNDAGPQAFVGAQVQVTPLFALSLATVAVIDATADVLIDAGGAWLNVTASAGAPVMVIIPVAICVESVTDVAIMVTLPPAGTVAGA